MKFYFHTHYAKDLCLQYMQNKNVNGIHQFWETKLDAVLIREDTW